MLDLFRTNPIGSIIDFDSGFNDLSPHMNIKTFGFNDLGQTQLKISTNLITNIKSDSHFERIFIEVIYLMAIRLQHKYDTVRHYIFGYTLF